MFSSELLPLHSGFTPSRAHGTLYGLGIEPRAGHVYKTRALQAVLSPTPLPISINKTFTSHRNKLPQIQALYILEIFIINILVLYL